MAKGLWLGVYLLVFCWSGWAPYDRLTWFLEVLPAGIGLGVLVATRRRFPLTRILYGLILFHAVILMVGGHYTYARVPLFDWIRESMGGTRNDFDKLGHLAQGLVPVMIAREIVLRRSVIEHRGWRNFFLVCFALALSAMYELIEWWVALAVGENAEAFLGTQGYVWDTQSDMGCALLGALAGLFLLAGWQDRQIRALQDSGKGHRDPVHFDAGVSD